jgi:hypothetical protein
MANILSNLSIGGAGVVPQSALDVSGMVRSTTYNTPVSGIGLELFYNDGNSTAYILSYDRATPYAGKAMIVRGKSIDIQRYNAATGAAATSALMVGDFNSPGVGIGMAPTVTLDVNGMIRSQSVAWSPTTGAGVEMFYAGGYGYINTFDRSGVGTWLPTRLCGSALTFVIGSAATGNSSTQIMWTGNYAAPHLYFQEGTSLSVGTTTGSMISMSASQKLSFHGATPVIQRAGAAQAVAPVGGTGTAAGGYDTAAHRDSLIALVNEMRAVLVEKGIMKGSA